MGVGNRILTRTEQVEPGVVEEYRSRALATANVADVMSRFGTMCGLRRVGGAGTYLAGPALTVRTRPTDNLMVHAALDLADPGDVLVVDAGGATDHAIIGALMVHYARRRGIAGLIIDGMARDADDLATLDLPVYARGINPNGPYKNGPGEINVPVSCGATAVTPGDLVLGDADGAVVVPRESAAEVAEAAAAVQDREEGTVRDIARDGWDRAWVQRTLHQNGCDHG